MGQTTPVPNDVLLAPSILAADYAVLAEEVERVRPECDWLHVDLMDGHFVPNLSIGPPVVASIRRHTDLFLDCHLMVTDPGFWLEQLAEAGADLCSVHVELGDPTPLLGRIRELGMQAGVVVDGPTAFEAVEPYLDERIDLLLVMTITAGFGGQPFVPEHLSKVERADADPRFARPAVPDPGRRRHQARDGVAGRRVRRRRPRRGERDLPRTRSARRGTGDPRGRNDA